MNFHGIAALFFAWLAGCHTAIAAVEWAEHKPRRVWLKSVASVAYLLLFAVIFGAAA